jgi:hybrid cluster-associated redox disulfide protein
MDDTFSAQQITAESLVQDVVERHPQTITIFARHRLQCVGCNISPFHTIADSTREHALSIEPLLGELNQVVVAEAT